MEKRTEMNSQSRGSQRLTKRQALVSRGDPPLAGCAAVSGPHGLSAFHSFHCSKTVTASSKHQAVFQVLGLHREGGNSVSCYELLPEIKIFITKCINKIRTSTDEFYSR